MYMGVITVILIVIGIIVLLLVMSVLGYSFKIIEKLAEIVLNGVGHFIWTIIKIFIILGLIYEFSISL